jgi:hypothetical protein
MVNSKTRVNALEQIPVGSIQFGLIAGIDPAIHLLAKRMDPRVIRAFTPVFAGYARG